MNSLHWTRVCALLIGLTTFPAVWADGGVDLSSFKGVALVDLLPPKEALPLAEPTPEESALRAVLKAAADYLAKDRDFALKKIMSMSFVANDPQGLTLTVEVLGRDPRFAVQEKDGLGGLGFIRAVLTYTSNSNLVEITGHKIELQRDFFELKPRVQVSVRERVAALWDDETGFKRVFPLGVGAIDKVRHFPKLTTMTPTLEYGFLWKKWLSKALYFPRYYRGKPFINVLIATQIPQPGVPVKFEDTGYAFHIWQEKGFSRGFLSHGCLRMRDEDLDEMLHLVLGARDAVPLKIRMEGIDGTTHPFPMQNDIYKRVKNIGTAEHPKPLIEADEDGVVLPITEWVKGLIPALADLVGLSIDPTHSTE